MLNKFVEIFVNKFLELFVNKLVDKNLCNQQEHRSLSFSDIKNFSLPQDDYGAIPD
jgi:hypothetical protein